jgi:hypothetical protein
LPFRTDFVTEFLATPQPEGAVLRVTQDGFPASPVADDCSAACGERGRSPFAGIRGYLRVAEFAPRTVQDERVD